MVSLNLSTMLQYAHDVERTSLSYIVNMLFHETRTKTQCLVAVPHRSKFEREGGRENRQSSPNRQPNSN